MPKRPSEQIPTIEEEEEQEQAMAEQEEEEAEEEEVDEGEPAKPLGKVTATTGTGAERRKHYRSFTYDERIFELGQTVLLTPDVIGKPYVAIIKDITEDSDGKLWVLGQWFYRPEDVNVEGEHCWKSRDSRDLFYSFHFDEVPAESVMHECVVHFVPLCKKLPIRAQHPGFIVQKLYDTDQKRVLDLLRGDYDKQKQRDIDLFFEKTRERLGELPDLFTEDSSAQKDDCLKSKKNLGKTVKPQVSGVDPTTRYDQLAKAYLPGSSVTDVSKYHAILSKFRVLTGDPRRDKCLEKLLHASQLVCSSKEPLPTEDSGLCSAISDVNFKICWPDEAIPIISTLERVTYEAMGVDFLKYNQKMRQLDFNIKNSIRLARRLLKKELEPISLLTMTPEELKEGLTADERIITEPEKKEQMQMTETRCSMCKEKQVGVADIIQGGRHGQRYQLKCTSCGHMWYASRDAIIVWR